MEAKGMSMFETVTKHDENIKEHQERIDSLEEVALSLKESDRQHDERLRNLEDNAVKLENTIMAENRDTRNVMKEQSEKLFVIVEKAMGYQSDVASHTHEQRMAKINTWSNVFLKIAGGVSTIVAAGYYVLKNYFGG